MANEVYTFGDGTTSTNPNGRAGSPTVPLVQASMIQSGALQQLVQPNQTNQNSVGINSNGGAYGTYGPYFYPTTPTAMTQPQTPNAVGNYGNYGQGSQDAYMQSRAQDNAFASPQTTFQQANGNTNSNGNYPTSTATSTTSAPSVTNNSNQISQMYQDQLSTAQAALQQAIQKSMQGYQTTIANAPGQYQPARDQASAAGFQQLNALKEMLANNGQDGGVNRTESTAVNSATQNNINALNLQQQNAVNSANQSINTLRSNGDLQSAQLVSQNASDKLQALIGEQNRVDADTYTRLQNSIKNAQADSTITGNYNGSPTLAARDAAIKNAQADSAITGNYQGNPTLAAKNDQATQALQLAQLLGKTADGTETMAGKTADLANQAQAIQNQYAPQIEQGTIDKTKLTNTYQSLVNNGYPADQAAKLASTYAQIAQGQASTAIAQQNADTAAGKAGVNGMGSGTVSGGTMPTQYSSWVNDAAAQNGIPPAILAGLIQTESSWDPSIVNSSSGATGLGQFLPSTAKEQGLSDSTDAKSSIYAAAKYLAARVKQAGSLNGGIMGYGEGTPEYLNKVLNAAKSYTTTKPTATQNTQAATSDAMSLLNGMMQSSSGTDAYGNPNPTYSGTDIQQFINDHAQDFEGKGVNVASLQKWAANAFGS